MTLPTEGRDDTAADPLPQTPVTDPAAPVETGAWQPLPVAARTLATITALIGTLLPLAVLLVPGLLTFGRSPLSLAAHAGALVLLPAWTVWIARRRWLRTRWRLDDDGLGIRRGHLWRSDVRVPGNRVQHLDIRRGPLERAFGLSTLTVHTAGTRNSAVALSGLDHAQAERLRDALAARAARDDDHDDT
ncbi:PH domain-containing protein [Luteimonas sp. S4-F44]|uniref:PH domain-containing protein n=1 Tax=Luteimonas sp. S4-F44 TaxID=2925842 RepID=UPI001F531321|nr:PH domain-containing protein [Luteimonas sp. S4-F44]UNK41841.1 PH domain-containing protein [Luteimonas sp. S4-F44]